MASKSTKLNEDIFIIIVRFKFIKGTFSKVKQFIQKWLVKNVSVLPIQTYLATSQSLYELIKSLLFI